MCRKIEPHIGMSREPCAVISSSPLITRCTRISGYFPLFFRLIWLRSAGFTFKAAAAGPLPFASLPWQTAQYSRNRSCPAMEIVGRAGIFLIFGVSSAPSRGANSSAARATEQTRLAGIILFMTRYYTKYTLREREICCSCWLLQQFQREKDVFFNESPHSRGMCRPPSMPGSQFFQSRQRLCPIVRLFPGGQGGTRTPVKLQYVQAHRL